jgi:ubiquinone/menaquinone biosynthesis C-methylase UbiE
MKNIYKLLKKAITYSKQRIFIDHIKFNDLSIGLRNQMNREVWLERTIKAIPINYRILDAGAGELQYQKYCGHLEYVSQDFAKYDGKGNNSGLQTETWDNSKLDIVSDITKIPLQDASFDAIMCIEVFEHLPEPILAIKEFSRLLKKNGILILTAPFCSLTHFAPYHYYSGFNKYFYEKHLVENGFEIIEITANGNYFDYISQELRRIAIVASLYGVYKNKKLDSYVNDLLPLLKELSESSKESSALLCFGYHVRAKRI